MTAVFRETVLTIRGADYIVRTELAGKVGTVKALEAAHMKAVKAAIVADRQAQLDAQYADMMADAQKPRRDMEGFPGSGERHRQSAMADAEAWRAKYGTAKAPANKWSDPRTPLRPLRTTDPRTYMVELEPGHYATREAAAGLGDVLT